MVLTEEGGGAKCFFLRFSTDAIVLLTSWVREGLCPLLLATTPLGTGAAFPLEECCQLKLKGTAQCSFGSHSVVSGGLKKILTRPNVEVKFSNHVTLKLSLLKGRGKFWQLVFGNGLLWLGLGGGLGLGNCLVYDFR